MTERFAPPAMARAFTEAWTSHNMDTAASYVADDVVFDGPMNHATGKAAYLQGLTTFGQTVAGARILAAFGDDKHALIMYEVTANPSVTLTCAELLTFRDGKIREDRLTFDTYPARMAGAGHAPASTAGMPTE